VKLNVPKFAKLQQLARLLPGLDAEAVCSCIPLLYLARELEAALDHHHQAQGLSRGRWQLMMQLYKTGGEGLTPAELADQTGVTRAAVTGLVDSLVEAGYVSRGEVGDDDRRTYRVRLTAEGNSFLEALLPDHLRRMQSLMEALTPAERQVFEGLTEKLRARLHVFRHDD
jgi:DNA-binding MarR family transcriptional regulator